MTGPLAGVKLVEFAGIGPGPFCGMVLADLGAEIIRIDRASQHGHGNTVDFQHRSKISLSADLKDPMAITEIKKLLTQVDGLIEGFRPGVMERLGLSPRRSITPGRKPSIKPSTCESNFLISVTAIGSFRSADKDILDLC